jgi:hypothetical protein
VHDGCRCNLPLLHACTSLLRLFTLFPDIRAHKDLAYVALSLSARTIKMSDPGTWPQHLTQVRSSITLPRPVEQTTDASFTRPRRAQTNQTTRPKPLHSPSRSAQTTNVLPPPSQPQRPHSTGRPSPTSHAKRSVRDSQQQHSQQHGDRQTGRSAVHLPLQRPENIPELRLSGMRCGKRAL